MDKKKVVSIRFLASSGFRPYPKNMAPDKQRHALQTHQAHNRLPCTILIASPTAFPLVNGIHTSRSNGVPTVTPCDRRPPRHMKPPMTTRNTHITAQYKALGATSRCPTNKMLSQHCFTLPYHHERILFWINDPLHCFH